MNRLDEIRACLAAVHRGYDAGRHYAYDVAFLLAVLDEKNAPPGTLTRREQFAMAAMQGWRANSAATQNGHLLSSEMIAEWSREDADALISALDKKEGE